jgi:Pvc16 N-terminal domain
VSTNLAVATTTRVLGSLLESSIKGAGVSSLLDSPPYFTAQAPDQVENGGQEESRLALFLYHVTYNQGWREVGLPSRNSAGQVIDRPPLAIDLHYLLVGYGKGEYVQHLLLGIGMQALHENPVLYRQQVAAVFTAPLNAMDAMLATSGIESQVELIKITPEPLSTDDLSKLWSSFGSKFRPSAGYVATTLLIESKAPVAAAPPVMARNLVVVQLRRPEISAVAPQYLPWASSGMSLTLTGTNLTGAGTSALFDLAPMSPQEPQRVDATTATVPVPPLPAGLNSLHVVQQLDIGAPPAKNLVQSNIALFHLQPVIRRSPSGTHPELITVGPVDNSVTPPIRTVTVQLDPALGSKQKVQLLLDELNPPVGQAPLSFTFDPRPDQIATNSVAFDTFSTRSGDYLLRVRVDGAESLPRTEPPGQEYTKPAVML